MNRSIALLAVLFSLVSGLSSQTIVITFEATLNSAPIALDSIRVMNLTAEGDTMIYFPDHVLVLGTTGISEVSTPRPSMQALPNPFVGTSEVVLRSVGGAALITLHDVAGRELVARSANLDAGIQRIRVSCERPGVHLLTVVQGGVRSTLRLTAMEGAGVAGISPVGGADQGAPKSDRSLFTWAPGDELRYIGYATDGDIVHSAAIDQVPDASSTRTFALFAGLACPESPFVTDIDGNVYHNVQIGGQCWMAESLRSATFSDGTLIPNVTDNIAWTQLNSGAWCNYANNPANDTVYGKLYNWFAAANPTICPLGWHLPTDAEWQTLEAALGMPGSELGGTGYYGAAQNVGGKMKTTTLWIAPNIGATNESGFTGLAGGSRHHINGNFNNLGFMGFWWSASESGSEGAWTRTLRAIDAGSGRGNSFKRPGYCVRCVRD